MDSVQRFIHDNRHQLGYIMGETSRQWIKIDPIGAITLGECNAIVKKYGDYNDILDKMQMYEHALKEILRLPEMQHPVVKVTAQQIAKLAIKE